MPEITSPLAELALTSSNNIFPEEFIDKVKNNQKERAALFGAANG